MGPQCPGLLWSCIGFSPWPCPGRPTLPLVRDDLSCQAPHAALVASPSPSPCSSATLAPHPTALALPLVFFSFLQTRQATKVLNPTRVPSASPPATTMPSSGTSTRVARSPAKCSLVRFQVGRGPHLGDATGTILSLPKVVSTAHSQDSPRGQQSSHFCTVILPPPEAVLASCWQCSPGAGSEALVTPTSLVATTERLWARLRSCSCTVWLVSQG